MKDFKKELTMLKESKLVLIHIENIGSFIEKCTKEGLNPQGGQVCGEYQYIYID